jgi:ATP/maltotriose-dependent transcriptional regulator MalT
MTSVDGNQVFDKAGFGVCVVDLHAGLLYQNKRCKEICQCQGTASCPLAEGSKQCALAQITRNHPPGDLHVHRAQEINHQFYDVAHIHEEGRDYRLIFPLDAKVESLNDVIKDHGLTPRELEIVSMLVLGLTNERVSERLNIARNTLRVHLKSIYRKLPKAARQLLGKRE